MQVRFRSKALTYIKEIVDYFETASPTSGVNVLTDIDRSVTLLKDYPHLGAPVEGYPLRRIVTRKYKFKIAYQVTAQAIFIIGIFRYQDREI
jgi:plasmid stabilization system protein ParE